MRGRGEDHVARSGRSTVRARTGRERRVLRIGLALSVVVHVVAVGILGGLLHQPRSGRPARPAPLVVEPPTGMRAVNLSPAPARVGAEPVPDPRRPEREEIAVVAPAPDRSTPERAVPDDLTAADRLAPRLVDPRIWRPMVLIPREPTFVDVQARLAAALELLSDSALAETERRVRATDWTVTDADGGRWGISPGVLHLGKLKLPLPVYVEEWNPERGEWYDLEAQVDRTRFVESFEDRVRAIRERRERERRERRPEDGGAVAGSGGSRR
ncbi:MAG TPA: hypothetical protein VMM12_13685 [Longimicrobiales bacterium]|nr:hypothetical protein [Longimicrobiales bacterium]